MSESRQTSGIEQQLEAELRASIGAWHPEVQAVLPGLQDNIDVEFDNEYLVPDLATGGATWSLNLIKLAYDQDFDAPDGEKLAELKATYFHESYHVFRGYSFETTPEDQSAMGIAIEEGLATKFEMLFAASNPAYADYEDKDTMLKWVKEVRLLPNGFDYDWQKYKFFDAETGRKWILYKIGVFIVDEAIKNSPGASLNELNNLSATEILALAKL